MPNAAAALFDENKSMLEAMAWYFTQNKPSVVISCQSIAAGALNQAFLGTLGHVSSIGGRLSKASESTDLLVRKASLAAIDVFPKAWDSALVVFERIAAGSQLNLLDETIVGPTQAEKVSLSLLFSLRAQVVCHVCAFLGRQTYVA